MQKDRKDGSNCPYCFLISETGECGLTSEVYIQAGFPKTQVAWDAYVERVQEAMKQCAFPDQLREALDNAKPTIKG